jgi:molybdate transport system regulatory protein
MGMSYRRAWMLIDTMNGCFRRPLVATSAGGRRGGGARVTTLGREVLRRYRAMETKARDSISAELRRFLKFLDSGAR